MASTSKDPTFKTKTARKPRKNTIPLTEESVRRLRDEDEEEEEEEEENDASILVARVKNTIDVPKATGSMAFDEVLSRTEGMSEKELGKVLESLEIEDASHRSLQMVSISEGAGPNALRTEENAPSESLGAIVIGDSPTLLDFFEGAIREARALGTLEVDGDYEGEDPFCDLFIGIEDAAGPSDVSGFFFEVQRTLNWALALHQEKEEEIKDIRAELAKAYQDQTDLTEQALALHQEVFSKSQTELSRRKADFRGLSEERNALKLLNGHKEEEIKDIRAELAKAYQDQTDLTEQVMIILKTHGLGSGMMANISISQLQQKLEVIRLLREEVDTIKAETLGWKEGMDHLTAEKETARAQLSSAESQLQGMKEKSSVQARKIKELEARLVFELAKAKSQVEKAKAEADAFMAVYRADAEAAQVQEKKAAKTAQTRSYGWLNSPNANLGGKPSRRSMLEVSILPKR
ncbi:intracellular protein transport protein uso1-like [Nicotiana tomentosiformis]|uniref:intracellular protein transport protein uso1-like n=1 Tax=Nicotiana tomentosiformis TaxID=4098 RepID=UPI00388CA91C